MKGFEIRFNLYANNEAEVEEARKAIVAFISELASQGIAVSAKKVADVVPQWKDNAFVRQQIVNLFKN